MEAVREDARRAALIEAKNGVTAELARDHAVDALLRVYREGREVQRLDAWARRIGRDFGVGIVHRRGRVEELADVETLAVALAEPCACDVEP